MRDYHILCTFRQSQTSVRCALKFGAVFVVHNEITAIETFVRRPFGTASQLRSPLFYDSFQLFALCCGCAPSFGIVKRIFAHNCTSRMEIEEKGPDDDDVPKS